MIRVHICMNDLTMDMDGHAGSQGEGQEFDMVCCAASFAAQALLYTLDQWSEQHAGITRMDLEQDKGHIHMHIVCHDWARVSIKRRIEYCRSGLEMLEERYPNYITVTEE